MAELKTLQEKECTSDERLQLFDDFILKGPENETVVTYYNTWGQFYDTDMNTANYINPRQVSDEAQKYFPDNKAIKILDVGAGTGEGGKKLKEAGFTDIDALDGSTGMLNVAKGLGVYKNLYQEIIGTDKINSVPPESYDLVTSSGAIYPKHIVGHHMKPIIGTCKKGGMIIISGCPYSDEGLDVRPALAELEKAGVVEMVSDVKIDQWYRGQDGFLICLKKK